MTIEECIKLFPNLKIENNKILYLDEAKTPAARLAYFLNLHREAIEKKEYSNYSPKTILDVEPFKSLLPSTDATESIDVIVSIFSDIRKRLRVKGDTKSNHFLKNLANAIKYVHSMAILERSSFINAFPIKNMETILSPIYSVDNPEYQWGVNMQSISADIEKIRTSSIELLEQLKNLEIDEELKVYLHTSLLSIIKALEHYQLCGIEGVESVIAQTMLRYHSVLDKMGNDSNEKVKDFSTKFKSLSIDILNIIKRTATKGLKAIGIYNEVNEFTKNLLDG